jgi:CubicO group peptidase (beta-lactamase class C family)
MHKITRRHALMGMGASLGAGIACCPWVAPGIANAADEATAGAPSEANCKLAADYSAKNTGLALLVLHEGKIVFERYDNGHAADTPGRLASATKSFWGPAAAAMVGDGLLKFDELVCETITEWKDDPRKSKITVRHLLSLMAGLSQRPTRTDDLYKHAVEAETVADPGAKFAYGPTALNAFGELAKRKLAAKKQSPLDYLKKRLLEPLGVKAGDWRKDRAGNAHITNGAQLTAREWLKFGQFLVQEGNWEGKPL